MNRPWLIRTLIALTAPVLLLAAPPAATAAPAAPDVPRLAQVVKVFPHLDGGTADVTRDVKVAQPGKKCNRTTVVKGAVGQTAAYLPQIDPQDAASFAVTGDEPAVIIDAIRFPSVKLAHGYMRAGLLDMRNCPPDGKFTMKKIRFTAGAERWGFSATWRTRHAITTANGLFARLGDKVVSTFVLSMDGVTTPSIPKSVALARLALKTAG